MCLLLGKPTEFLSLSAIKQTHGHTGIADLPEPALFTDGTQMSIAIPEAPVKSGEIDIDEIMGAVKQEFIKWLHSPEKIEPLAGHQIKSTLLTTNLLFARWGDVFNSTTVATAITDRLVHNSKVLILGGSSYRRKQK